MRKAKLHIELSKEDLKDIKLKAAKKQHKEISDSISHPSPIYKNRKKDWDKNKCRLKGYSHE